MNLIKLTLNAAFRQFRRNYKRITYPKSLQRTNHVTKFSRQFYESQMYATLALLWPVKKKEEKKEKGISELDRADSLFDNCQYEDCYELLLKCQNEQDPKDVEVQWRICRVLYELSKQSKYDDSKRKDFILQAYEIISNLLQDHQDHFAVQKWYAVLLDAKSSYKGIKERIKQIENVKKHLDLAATLNPSDAAILHMLGEWCYQVTEMPWHQRKIAETFFATVPHSSYEDALEYFLKAENAQPRFYSMNLLRLGSCYLNLHKEDRAKYYLKLAASYPAKTNDDHQANKEAIELLKKLH